MKYFEIKRVDVERIDIERSEGAMSHRHLAATPWEVEAERRREVLDRDLPNGGPSDRGPRFAALRRRVSGVRGLFSSAPPAGKLDRKHV